MMHVPAVTGFLALLAISFTAPGCAPEYEQTPQSLRGVWTTDAPGYEGRYLTIEPSTVVFGVRGVQTARRTVHRVLEADAPGGRVYDLRCVGAEGREIGVHLVLAGANGSELHLKHRPKIIWTREEAY
jgi:hypothetical protein